MVLSIFILILGILFIGAGCYMMGEGEVPGVFIAFIGLFIFVCSSILIFDAGKAEASNKSLTLMTKTNVVALKVDKQGDTYFTLKDSSYIDLYNYLKANIDQTPGK